jgi:Family of unknown function (DUF5906)/Primase C terminal 2 (PriCT-2)
MSFNQIAQQRVPSVFVTQFPNKKACRFLDRTAMTPDQLADMIENAKPRTDKALLIWLKLAQFGNRRSENNCLRWNENVVAVSGVEGDYDGEQMAMEAAAKLLRDAGVAAILYTTASHTPETPRWRVLAFLSKPITGTTKELDEARKHNVGIINAILGGVLARESFVLSTAFYYGGVQGGPKIQVIRVPGACVDQLRRAPAPLFPKGKGAGSNYGEPHKTPEELRSPNLERTRSQLRFLPNDAAMDEETWDDYVNMGLAAEGAGLSKEDWVAWSAKSPKHNQKVSAEDQWDGFNSHSLGWKYIRDKAIAAGWKPEITAVDTTPDLLTLDDMLDRFVLIETGPQIIDTTNTNRTYLPQEFNTAFAHCLKKQKEKKAVSITKLWRQDPDRMTAYARNFYPGKPQFYRENRVRYFNSWREPKWPEVDVEYAKPFFRHVKYLIPDATCRKDFLDWLAHAVQDPRTRPHHHFLLVAPNEGTGRSWLISLFKCLYTNRHATQIDAYKWLSSNFNEELAGKVIVGVHEVRMPNDERFNSKDRLKSQLTDDEIWINPKNVRQYIERFVARCLMLSNREDALPLTELDRRVYVVACAENPKPQPYYPKLYGRLKSKRFLAAVWTALKNRDIAGFDPGRRAPMTAMKEQMIAAGRSQDQQMAVDLVNACPYAVVSGRHLMRALVSDSTQDRGRRMNAVIAVLQDCGKRTLPTKYRVDDSVGRVWLLSKDPKWRTASRAEIVKEAERATKDFNKHPFNADQLLAEWTPS